jgi:hypothetical protein
VHLKFCESDGLVRPVMKIQLRPTLDVAQREMLHCVEADGVQAQGIYDGMSYFFQISSNRNT